MTALTVDLGERGYPIHIGAGTLASSGWWAEHVADRTVAIVSNTTVAPLYAQTLLACLEPLARQVVLITLPDGEEYKTSATLNQVYDELLANRCDRSTVLVALGGGVVGDIAGFAAATYQRGIAFIQVPTTLLAQVDSSVGGKTGINHPMGKNMIGAFYQPRAVLIDVDTLESLPARQFSAGLAEIVKHGAACDARYFAWLEEHFPDLLAREPNVVAEAIAGSCRIKARIVAEDERESGKRAILNFGHTFGHAIENAMGYGTWLHGEAVAAGMMLAARLSVDVAGFDAQDAARLGTLLQAAHLPTIPPVMGAGQWRELMGRDKKASQGAVRFVLLRALGDAVVTPVAEPALSALLFNATVWDGMKSGMAL